MDNLDENVDRNTIFNVFTFFIDGIVLYVYFLVAECNFARRRIMQRFEMSEFIDSISETIAEYPPLKYLILPLGLICVIPIVTFVMFGIITIAITFSGFLFLEGTILAFGGFCLGLCILSLILVLSLLALTSCCLYLIITRLGIILNKFEPTSHLMRRLNPQISNLSIENSQISSLNAHPHQN